MTGRQRDTDTEHHRRHDGNSAPSRCHPRVRAARIGDIDDPRTNGHPDPESNQHPRTHKGTEGSEAVFEVRHRASESRPSSPRKREAKAPAYCRRLGARVRSVQGSARQNECLQSPGFGVNDSLRRAACRKTAPLDCRSAGRQPAMRVLHANPGIKPAVNRANAWRQMSTLPRNTSRQTLPPNSTKCRPTRTSAWRCPVA